jgi:hypothetical protein
MPPTPPTKAHAAAFICARGEWALSACKALPFFKEHEGKRYCVLHYPGGEKVAAFNAALRRKFDARDFDLRGVFFPDDADFSDIPFDTPVDFTGATFSAGANFNYARFNAEVYFSSVTFGALTSFSFAAFDKEADFNSAAFRARVNFGSATFEATAYFRYTTFGAEANFDAAAFRVRANFDYAVFEARAAFKSTKFGRTANFAHATFRAEASFESVTFSRVAQFRFATFNDYVRFAGGGEEKFFDDGSSLSLQLARIEKGARISFHTLTLRPHWFVNVNARRFEFINVDWNWPGTDARREIRSVGGKDVLSAHRLLAVACRNLAANAEENQRYEEASNFRYMAMEARRLERWRGFAFWTLGWWYWLASGYGERIGRAFFMLLGILVLFAALYVGLGLSNWRTNAERATGRPRWSAALLYSAGVMTLQKPEPRPATDAAQAVVMLETILGPVQAALLALAIRRKFMR